MPDLGGRLYSCIDKINGKDLFYANPGLKRVPVADGSVQIVAGDQFDFPNTPGHETASPVEWFTRRDQDGNSSIFVASADRRNGLRWHLEIILRPGIDAVEQRVTLSNPTPTRLPYAWFNTARIPAFTDTRLTLPCHIVSDGDNHTTSWPVDSQGRDLSLLANHTGAFSVVAVGCREGFIGVYSPQEQRGTVHFADPKVAPGKRIQLRDDGRQYVELQSALFSTPDDREFLNPLSRRQFTEYWMPVRGLGGISRLNGNAAVFLRHQGTDLQAAIQVYRRLTGARVRILEGGQTIWEQSLTLDPAQPWTHTLSGTKPNTTYRIQLLDPSGAELLSHTESYYDAESAAPPLMKSAPISEEREALEKATAAEKRGDYSSASKLLQDALQRFPSDQPLNLAAGRIDVLQDHFLSAVAHLAKAPPSPETNHYLGLAYLQSGQLAKAQAVWSVAKFDRLYGVPSTIQLAQSLARAGDSKAAYDALSQALKIRPDLAGVGTLEAALLRQMNRPAAASQRLHAWLSHDPADVSLRYEKTLLGSPDDQLWPILAANPNTIVRISDGYIQMGDYPTALALLDRSYPQADVSNREPGMLRPQDYILLSYYRAFCRTALGQSAREDLLKASKQDLASAAPVSPESKEILLALQRQHPDDSQLNRLVALIEETASAAPILPTSASTPAPPPVPKVESFPDSTPDQKAEAALRNLEAGRIGDAAAIFNERNFPKEKQSDFVRQAFLEVRLQAILDLARRKRCNDALTAAEALGDEDPQVPFSLHGFGNLIKSPRLQYILATVEVGCGDEKAARKRFTRAAKAVANPPTLEFAYTRLAAAKVSPFDSKATLLDALAQVKQTSSSPEALCSQALLERILQQPAAADDRKRALEATVSPRLLHYFCATQ